MSHDLQYGGPAQQQPLHKKVHQTSRLANSRLASDKVNLIIILADRLVRYKRPGPAIQAGLYQASRHSLLILLDDFIELFVHLLDGSLLDV
jgi:hypothetical protein